MAQVINHTGIVEKIRANCVTVRISQTSACAGCSAAHLCKTSESKERSIEVFTDNAENFTEGDAVLLQVSSRQGMKAVVIAYLVPLILIVPFLSLAHAIGLSDAFAGMLSLLILLAYYSVLFLLRNRLEKVITFRIIKSQ